MTRPATPAAPDPAAVIRNIGIIGAGRIGASIAQVFAQAGFNVHLLDTGEDRLSSTMDDLARGLGRLAEKGEISEFDRWEALARIRVGLSYDMLADCDLVISHRHDSICRTASRQEPWLHISQG